MEDKRLWNTDFSSFDGDLKGADFTMANLYQANFNGVDLTSANFSGADLRFACFRDAHLEGVDFGGTDLTGVNFRGANLQGVDFRSANLFGADLRNTNLRGVVTNDRTVGYCLACPSEGAFIAFKKAGGYIVVLEVPADAKRSSATTYKCRCDKAKVLRIEKLDGTPADVTSVASDFFNSFIYKVSETVSVDNFDENRWQECSRGIHFFVDRQLAVLY